LWNLQGGRTYVPQIWGLKDGEESRRKRWWKERRRREVGMR